MTHEEENSYLRKRVREAEHNSNSSIGFASGLTLLFVGLRLCDVIDWAWWWVVSPIWISFLLCLIIAVVIVINDMRQEKKWQRIKQEWRERKKKAGL